MSWLIISIIMLTILCYSNVFVIMLPDDDDNDDDDVVKDSSY